jgi:tetratricopeptide (TPR) repeat protein
MIDFAYKIQIPQRPPYVVSRPRLNELLNSITERRLITICAPPGYGKTSLLVDFANSAPLPVCWYTLDFSDQDPWLFLEYLVAAVENRFVEAARQTRLMLSGYSHTAFMSVVSSFARDIYQISQDFAVILDDWHLIDGVPEIREAVGLILTRCPNCKIILASRTYPSLPSLMLLAARRQMLGFDERQMRFTNEEVSDVLGSELESEVTREQIDTLTEQSNGWITGILLLLQTGDPSLSESMPARVGAERQVYQFLAEQVFDQQDQEIQQFLLQTSLLEELTAKLCNTILRRNNSAKLLKMLIKCHMFISEIKDGVFRYHPLFREFLQEHFQVINPEQYQETVLLIADMYSSERQWLQAFDMYIAVGQYEKAQQIVLQGGEHLYALGRLETLESWFQTLPTDGLAVPLMSLQARVAMDRGDIHKAKTLAQQATLRMRPEDEPMVLLLQAQIARVMGDYQDILALAERILGITDDLGLRSSALRIIGVYYQRQGHVTRGIGKLEEALCIEQQHGDLNAIAKIQHELGIAYKTIGLFSIAEQYYANVEAYCTTVGNVGLRALSLNSKGIMQYLMGRYYEAHQSLTTALQDARASAVPPYQAAVLSSLGDLYASLQLWERARMIYNDARALGGTATIRSDLDLAQIQLLIGQHCYEEAAQALQDIPRMTAASRSNQILLLEGIIACGLKQYALAQEKSQRLIDLIGSAGASMDLALAFVLQAEIAARAHPGQTSAMLKPLEQAAQIADKLGHNTFLISAMLRMPDVLRRGGRPPPPPPPPPRPDLAPAAARPYPDRPDARHRRQGEHAPGPRAGGRRDHPESEGDLDRLEQSPRGVLLLASPPERIVAR